MLWRNTFFCMVFLTGCSEAPEFYHGYVYDQKTQKPLANIQVKEDYPSNSKSAYTDTKGYFKIKKDPQSITDLIFSSPDYGPDTLLTVWSQHGESIGYVFVNAKPDTAFLTPKK